MYFYCAGCERACAWDSRAHVDDKDPDVLRRGVKSIGGRYCHQPECIEDEAKSHGLPIEGVLPLHGDLAILADGITLDVKAMTDAISKLEERGLERLAAPLREQRSSALRVIRAIRTTSSALPR